MWCRLADKGSGQLGNVFGSDGLAGQGPGQHVGVLGHCAVLISAFCGSAGAGECSRMIGGVLGRGGLADKGPGLLGGVLGCSATLLAAFCWSVSRSD